MFTRGIEENLLSQVGKAYGDLQESSFDADPDTLTQLQLLQQLCSSLAQWIEMVCLKGSMQGSMYRDMEIEFAPCLDKPKEQYGIDIQVRKRNP